MATETQLVPIDNQLRLVLFGLECALDVEFAPDVVEQIFADAQADARNEKRYTLWLGPRLKVTAHVARLKVTAHVEGYEPEDLWLTVEAHTPFNPTLPAILERARYQAYRLERWQESEPPAV